MVAVLKFDDKARDAVAGASPIVSARCAKSAVRYRTLRNRWLMPLAVTVVP